MFICWPGVHCGFPSCTLHSPLLLCVNCTVLTCRSNGTVKIYLSEFLLLFNFKQIELLSVDKCEICVSWVHVASDLTMPSPWIPRSSSFQATWPWKELRGTLSLWLRHGIPLLFFLTPHECNFFESLCTVLPACSRPDMQKGMLWLTGLAARFTASVIIFEVHLAL